MSLLKKSKKLLFSFFLLFFFSSICSAGGVTEVVKLLPGISQDVFLSNRDVNRIYCSGGRPVREAVFSEEKGISLKTSGSDVFIKFLLRGDAADEKDRYIRERSEFYIICEPDTVYTIISSPKNIPAQTVRLGGTVSDNIKKNIALFSGQSFEDRIVHLVMAVAGDSIPDSFRIKNKKKYVRIFQDVEIFHNRTVTADGGGLFLKEFVISLKENCAEDTLRISEESFIVPELVSDRLAGITLESFVLKKGKYSRLFIVEKL